MMMWQKDGRKGKAKACYGRPMEQGRPFSSCGFFFFFFFFPRLILAVADWMSAILPHM